MPLEATLNKIQQNLGGLGDLPVFSTTLNRIKQISSSDESDAMALAMVIMKDPNLTARLLSLANSPTYHRGQGPIKVVSRAVVMLGFNQIKNLSVTLKLVEQFQNKYPDLHVPQMMVRAVLGANLAREFALKSCRQVDAEEAYICALLLNIGEIIVACTLPETYREMLDQKKQGAAWPDIQQKVLGSAFSELGQTLVNSWGYPNEVAASMRFSGGERQSSGHELSAGLAQLSDVLLGQLYDPDSSESTGFNDVILKVAELTLLPADDVSGVVVQSFKKMSRTCRDFGFSQKHLLPEYSETGEEERDELIRQVAFLLHSEAEDEAQPVDEASDQLRNVMQENDRNKLLLDYLRRFSELAAAGDRLHEVFKLFVDAVVDCTRFDRVIIGLLNNQQDYLSVKLLGGGQTEALQRYFQRGRDGSSDDLFFKVMQRQNTFLVDDVSSPGWQQRLPDNFIRQVNCRGFVLEPLSRGKRNIGMLYADFLPYQQPISDEDFESFEQFAGQVRLALKHAGRPG